MNINSKNTITKNNIDINNIVNPNISQIQSNINGNMNLINTNMSQDMQFGNNIGGNIKNMSGNINNYNMNVNINNINNNMNVNINNQMNNMNNNNNEYLPMKTIKNYNLNREASFANSVLQSLVSIGCIKSWLNKLFKSNIMNNVEDCLTKKFYQLYYSLNTGQDKIDSTDIIIHLENKIRELYKKDFQKDPFHFFFYFLDLLHFENNAPLDPNYDKNSYQKKIIDHCKDDNLVFKAFIKYFTKTQNSIISDNFFNSAKYIVKCPSDDPYYCYNTKKIIYFNIDEYKTIREPSQIGKKFTIDECFTYYYKERLDNQMCILCNTYKASSSEQINTTTKILILAFKRKIHPFVGDVDFDLQLSMSKYTYIQDNNQYILKAIISYRNTPKYFADININNNWYRFTDNHFNDSKRLNSTSELYEFEPQILIYELEDNKPKNQNNKNINENNNSLKSSMKMQIEALQKPNINFRIIQNFQLCKIQPENNNNNNINYNKNNNINNIINNNISNNNINNNNFNNFIGNNNNNINNNNINNNNFNNFIGNNNNNINNNNINYNNININGFNNNFNGNNIINNNLNNNIHNNNFINNAINQNYNKTFSSNNNNNLINCLINENSKTLNISNNNNNSFSIIKFYIIPENWDGKRETANKLCPHATLDDTFEKLINHFFIKLQKPREAIKKFKFNKKEIRPDCKEKLRNLGITEASHIFAIKSDNFDSLK